MRVTALSHLPAQCSRCYAALGADADYGCDHVSGSAKFAAVARRLFRRYLAARPLSYWVMTWFLFELVVLTAIGTLFRGPGWSLVWPWQGS